MKRQEIDSKVNKVKYKMQKGKTSLKNIDEVSYYLKLIWVCLKIKFPCKMFITHNGVPLTKQVDIHTPLNKEIHQQKNMFVFDQNIRVQMQVQNQLEEITLTVNLKTAKGSTYQAGLIKLKHQELVSNEGKQETVKVPVIKSLDTESCCMMKVERIEFVRTGSSNIIGEDVESQRIDYRQKDQIQSKGYDVYKQELDPESLEDILQKKLSEPDQQKGKKFKRTHFISKSTQQTHKISRNIEKKVEQLTRKSIQQNVEGNPLLQKVEKKSLLQFASQQEHSSVYQTQSQSEQDLDSHTGSKKLLQLLGNSVSDGSDPLTNNLGSRSSLDHQVKEHDHNHPSHRYKQQYENLESTKNYSSSKFNSPSINSPINLTLKINSSAQYTQQQSQESHQVSDELVSELEQEGQTEQINHKVKLLQIAAIQPFTPIVLMEKVASVSRQQNFGGKKFESIAVLNSKNYDMEREINDRRHDVEWELMRKSILKTKNYKASHQQSDKNYKNPRISQMFTNDPTIHHNMLHSSKTSHQTSSQPHCQMCQLLLSQLSQQKVLSQGFEKKLQLIKLAESESSYLKQESILKQQSIYLLQQKLKHSVSQNLSLQQVNQSYQIDKIKLQKYIQQKQLIISQLQDDFALVLTQMQNKDKIIQESEDDIKKVKRQMWDLRKELIDREESVSMKEIQEMQINSKHKKQLLDLQNQLNQQKQEQIKRLQNQLNKQKEQQLNTLQQKLSLVQKQLQQARQSSGITFKESQELKEQNQTMKKKIYETQVEISSLKSQVKMLKHCTVHKQQQYNQSILIKHQSQQQIRKLSVQNQMGKNLIEKLQQQVIELKRSKDQLQEKLNKVQLKNLHIETEQTKTKQGTLKEKEENMQLKVDNTLLEQQINALVNQVTLLKGDKMRLTNTNRQLEQAIGKIQQQRFKTNGDSKQIINQNHKQLQADQWQLQTSINSLIMTNSKLQLQVSLLRQQVSNLTQQKLILSEPSSDSQTHSNSLKQLELKQEQLEVKLKQLEVDKNQQMHDNIGQEEGNLKQDDKVQISRQAYRFIKDYRLRDMMDQRVYLQAEIQLLKNKSPSEKHRLHMATQEFKLVQSAISQLNQHKFPFTKIDQQKLNHPQTDYYPQSACQTPIKSSLILTQPNTINKVNSQSKQQDAFYRQLLRRKDEQIELLMRQFEQAKLSLYKSEKQLKMARHQTEMLQDEGRRLLMEIREQKGKYSKLVSNKNQLQLTHSKLLFQLQQLKQDSLHKHQEFAHTISQLQDTIHTLTHQSDRKSATHQHQITTLQSTIAHLQTAIQDVKREIDKHKKEQRIGKDVIDKLNRDKQALNKEKAQMQEQLTNKLQQIENLRHLNELATSNHYQLISDQELLNKKHFILQQALLQLKQNQTLLKTQIKHKDSLIQTLNQLLAKTKSKITQLAQILISQLHHLQSHHYKLSSQAKLWLEKVEKAIPQHLVRKLQYQKQQAHQIRQLSFSLNNTNNNSITFFKPSQYHPSQNENDKLGLYQLNQENDHEIIEQNQLSSIIQNTDHLENLSPSKLFGSITGFHSQELQLNLQLVESSQNNQNNQNDETDNHNKANSQNDNSNNSNRNKKQENIHCYEDEQILLNQSLTNDNMTNENKIVIDNSFGNINLINNQMHNSSSPIESLKVNQSMLIEEKRSKDDNAISRNANVLSKDDNVLYIERLELDSRQRKMKRELREKYRKSGQLQLMRGKLMQEQKGEQPLINRQKQKDSGELKNATQLQQYQQLNGFSSLISIVEGQNQSRAKGFIFDDDHSIRQTHLKNDFIQYLNNCLHIDTDQQLFKKCLEQSIHLNDEILLSPLLVVNQIQASHRDENIMGVLQNSDILQHLQSMSSLPPATHLSTYLSAAETYLHFLLQEHEFLTHKISQYDTTIEHQVRQLQEQSIKLQQNSNTIASLQNELQNQQIEFNEWMGRMEHNLNHHSIDRTHELIQVKKQYNSLLNNFRQLQSQLQSSIQQLQKEQQKTLSYKQMYHQQEQLNTKHESQLTQKINELHETQYQLCIKEEQYEKDKNILTDKLILSNNHLLALQTQSIKLDHQFIRVKSQYESMLQYGEQEKQYLKDKIIMIQHDLLDAHQDLKEEKQRRINAEKLDNFQQANRLFDENQKLKKEIMKLKRQTRLKEVSASVIMKEKDSQIQMWRSMLHSHQQQPISTKPKTAIKHKVSPILHVSEHPQFHHHSPKQLKHQIVESIDDEYDEGNDKDIETKNNYFRTNNFNDLIQRKSFKLSDFQQKQSIEFQSQSSGPYRSTEIENPNQFSNQQRRSHIWQNNYEDIIMNALKSPDGKLPKSFRFETKQVKQVDSVNSSKADEMQNTLNKLNFNKNEQDQSKKNKQEKYVKDEKDKCVKDESELKKQQGQLDCSLKLLKKQRMKRAQTIQVDLQEFKNMGNLGRSGLQKEQGKELLFIKHQRQDIEIDKNEGIDHVYSWEKVSEMHGVQNNGDQKPEKQRKGRPLERPKMLAYSTKKNYYRCAFAEDEQGHRLANSAQYQMSNEQNKQPLCHNPNGFQTEVNQNQLSEIRSYANINIVNSEEEIQIIDQQQPIGNSLDHNQHEQVRSIQNELFSPLDHKPTSRTSPTLVMKIVHSIDYSQDEPIYFQDQLPQIQNSNDNLANGNNNSNHNLISRQNDKRPYQSVQFRSAQDQEEEQNISELLRAEFQKILQ